MVSFLCIIEYEILATANIVLLLTVPTTALYGGLYNCTIIVAIYSSRNILTLKVKDIRVSSFGPMIAYVVCDVFLLSLVRGIELSILF